MTLRPQPADSGPADRSDYWRRYYLAHREQKIEAAKASYRRRREAAARCLACGYALIRGTCPICPATPTRRKRTLGICGPVVPLARLDARRRRGA